MEPAPFHSLAEGDGPAADAFWMHASDGIRLRLVLWTDDQRPKIGSVLLFPGRTEYAEKYGPIAARLIRAGYDVLTLDWRGQGLSDRFLPNPRPGHVDSFDAYRHDVDAMVQGARKLNLPRPWHLLSHSMGGCIGLAALIGGLDVVSATFSAPMWGINFQGVPAILPQALAGVAARIGLGGVAAPGSGGAGCYLLDQAFRDNVLTGNAAEWARMLQQAARWPELTIGGASFGWLHAALRECRRLAPLPSPDIPMLVSLGSAETVVSAQAIRARCAAAPQARLLEIPGARHEAMMETPDPRRVFLEALMTHLQSAR